MEWNAPSRALGAAAMVVRAKLAHLALALAALGCAVYDKRDPRADEGQTDAGTTSDTGSNVDIPITVNPDARQGGGTSDGGRAPPPNPGPIVVTQGSVPSDVATRFGNAISTEDANGPELVYPTPETMFPPDLGRILFQWTAKSGLLFHVHFGFPKNPLDIYTDGSHAACLEAGLHAQCWESSLQDLAKDFAFEAGSTFTLQIGVLDPSDPGKAHLSREYSFRVAPDPALGVIYYWSTTAKGVRRATLDGRGASDYLTPSTGLTAAQAAALTPADQQARCVACHTLSRSGKKLSISLQGDQLGVTQITPSLPPPFTYASASGGAYGNDAVVGASWVTFSPDENKIITAANGQLTLRDLATAHRAPSIAPVALPVAPSGSPYFGSMPDWAPDGRHVAMTATAGDLPTAKMARHIRGSSIAWMSAQGNAFSGFELLAESRGVVTNDCLNGINSPDNVAIHGSGRESFANPMFSPDSRWVAFSRADCESEGDPTAEIIVTRAERGAAMDHLVRMNTDVGGVPLSLLTNGMPTWGPRIKSNIAWLAFTSTRNYGLVIAPGTGVLRRVGWPVRQLWVAAIDLSKLGTDQEASFPAFRMPSQDFDENNHRPFWTVDVIPDAPVNIDPRVN
jgi:hypothetical protein